MDQKRYGEKSENQVLNEPEKGPPQGVVDVVLDANGAPLCHVHA